MRAVNTSLFQGRTPLLIGGMALAMLAGGLTWRGVERMWSPEAPVAQAPAPVPAPEPVLAPVTLDVRTVPTGARVVRADTGEALGVTPLVKQLPRSNEPLGLRVELAGHVSQEREVRLDANAFLEVPLVKAPAPAPAAPPKAAPRKDVKRDELIDPFAM
jgi:hypothetical protein